MTTGERIKARRKDLGISADALADIIGVSRSTMFRYENGFIEKMPIDRLIPIAQALNTTVAYLMGWDNEEKPATKNDDGRTKEFADLFTQLTEAERNLVIAQIKGILSSR